MDWILTGKPAAKVVYIETGKITHLSQQIYQELGQTASAISVRTPSSGEQKELLLVAIDSSQINRLRDIVKLHDPEAFVIVSDATELLGNGF